MEMLAANGSIFTILAISFERYYAICKPLKAGYKCTRVRATVIICFIWLLASVLTSPILIMAKSSQTIYIDGSLVYNCILETDSYWPKMYVFVSMFAFFCLPLLILILVYWLIGRRLTRENLAMSTTTTSLAANDSIESTKKANYTRKRVFINKTVSLKSLSTFLSSAWHTNNYHNINGHQSSSRKKRRAGTLDGSANQCLGSRVVGGLADFGAREPTAPDSRLADLDPASGSALQRFSPSSQARPKVCKAFSLDHQQLMAHRQAEVPARIRLGALLASGDMAPDGAQCQATNGVISALVGKLRQASQFINKLFSSKSSLKCRASDTGVTSNLASSGFGAFAQTNRQSILSVTSNIANGDSVSLDGQVSKMRKVDAANHKQLNFSPKQFDFDLAQDQAQPDDCQATFAHRAPTMTSSSSSSCGSSGKDKGISRLKFRWFKSSSISSSHNSEHTSTTICTNRDFSSLSPQHSSSFNRQPKSILLCDSSDGSARIYLRRKNPDRKKLARFDLDSLAGHDSYCPPTHQSCSSTSDPNSSSPSSHSSSPDSLFEQQHVARHQRRGNTNSPGGVSLSVDLVNQKVRDFGALKEDDVDTSAQSKRDSMRSATLSTVERRPVESMSSCDELEAKEHPNPCTSCPVNRKGDCFSDLFASLNCDNQTKSTLSGQNATKDIHSSHSPSTLMSRFDMPRGRSSSQPNGLRSQTRASVQLDGLLVVQSVPKKQQMDSRRQVVVMLAFVVACFFLLFFPYRLFTFWLILSTEDQVQSLGMETYYNLTYFSRILIYLHSAINPIAYNLISTKFRRAFISILFCQGSSSRRHFAPEYQIVRQDRSRNPDHHKRLDRYSNHSSPGHHINLSQ